MEAVCIIILSSGYCLRVNCLHVQTVQFFLSNIPKSLYVLFISLKIMLLFKIQQNKVPYEKQQSIISGTGPLFLVPGPRPNLHFLQQFKITCLSLPVMDGPYT